MATSNSDLAAKLDIICRRGDTFYRSLTFTINGNPEDFTGSAFKMQVRLSTTIILDFTSSNITITGNTIELYKSEDNMKTVRPGKYQYDLEQTLADGTVITRIAGSFTINPDSTQ